MKALLIICMATGILFLLLLFVSHNSLGLAELCIGMIVVVTIVCIYFLIKTRRMKKL